jgi:hypothetical protein
LRHKSLEILESFLSTFSPIVWDILVGEICEEGSYGRVVWDEMVVVVAETEEGLEFLKVHGSRPSLDGLHLLGVGCDALCRDDVTEVFDGGLEEFTLCGLAIELMFAEEVKDLSQVLLVVVIILAVDEDVINVNDDTFIEQGTEDALN